MSRNFPTLLAYLQKSPESGSILEAFFKQNHAVNSSPLSLSPGPDAEEGEETSKSKEPGVAGRGHKPQPSCLTLCSPSWWPHPGRKVQWQNQQKFWLFTGLSFRINKLKLILSPMSLYAFPSGKELVKNLPAMQETQVQSLGWEDPWRRKWQPTPVLLPGEFHWQRSRAGYSPWDLKESHRLATKFHFHFQWSVILTFFESDQKCHQPDVEAMPHPNPLNWYRVTVWVSWAIQ